MTEAPDSSGLGPVNQSYLEAALCLQSLAHDLNNQLGAVSAFAELIGMETQDAPEIQNMVANIIASVQKSTALVGTLMSALRPDEDTVTRTDVPELLRQVAELFLHETKKEPIDFSLDTNGDGPPIHAVRAKLTRAFMAIIRDAVERVRAAPRKSIHIVLDDGPEGIRIQLRDSGQAPPDLESSAETAPRYSPRPGLVIRSALSEARQLIRFHQGDLTYDSESGLTLWIPRETGLGSSG